MNTLPYNKEEFYTIYNLVEALSYVLNEQQVASEQYDIGNSTR